MPRLTARAKPSGSGALDALDAEVGRRSRRHAAALLDDEDAQRGAAITPQRGEAVAQHRALAQRGHDDGDVARAHSHRNLKRSTIKRLRCRSSSGGSGPPGLEHERRSLRPVERPELDRRPVALLDEVVELLDARALAPADAQRERRVATAQVARFELDRDPIAARRHRHHDPVALGQQPGATIPPAIDRPHRRIELAARLRRPRRPRPPRSWSEPTRPRPRRPTRRGAGAPRRAPRCRPRWRAAARRLSVAREHAAARAESRHRAGRGAPRAVRPTTPRAAARSSARRARRRRRGWRRGDRARGSSRWRSCRSNPERLTQSSVSTSVAAPRPPITSRAAGRLRSENDCASARPSSGRKASP